MSTHTKTPKNSYVKNILDIHKIKCLMWQESVYFISLWNKEDLPLFVERYLKKFLSVTEFFLTFRLFLLFKLMSPD